MRSVEGRLSTSRIVFGMGVAFLFCVAGLAACGGGESETSTPVVAATGNVGLGKTIRAGDWEAALISPPEQAKIVGEGNITYQAEGTYLLVFLKITNSGDVMQLIPRDLFKVQDDQGREFKAAKSAIQTAFVLQRGMELSLDSPLASKTTRDSVIIFDVPVDAKGLKLTIGDSGETLNLGF